MLAARARAMICSKSSSRIQKIHSDMVQTFLLLDTITNEKTVKFLQLDIFTRHPDLQVPIILTMQ